MTNKIPLNYQWELVKTDLEVIISGDSETFLDQCEYSLYRQLQELEAIHRRSGELIHELATVQRWLRGQS
jgi:hypothetical protein